MRAAMQSLVRAVYPPQCVACGTFTESDFALCGPCWRDAHFIGGLVCDLCGAPLPGDVGEVAVPCDDCLAIGRPWTRGRAVVEYRDTGRSLVLALKHGDRVELSRAAGDWMAARAGAVVAEGCVIVPVPLHWRRLLVRRYNQSALLARALGRRLGLPVLPDALVRVRPTAALGGLGREARFAVLSEAIRPHPRGGAGLAGRPVLLVDDVMTSGATLAACTEALDRAGAASVSVLALARAVKDA